jgi:hypothetical protein
VSAQGRAHKDDFAMREDMRDGVERRRVVRQRAAASRAGARTGAEQRSCRLETGVVGPD